ncbi:MAG: cobalamin-dependent protein [Desulfobacteraceae bacterium]|nr:cobalamin-dependent protein [Desulfobacteraceae bacterium]
MKIFLVNPSLLDFRSDEYDAFAVPTGLYYIGALLKKHGFDVDIVNLAIQKQPFVYLNDLLKEERPDMVAFSVLNANRFSAFEAATATKKFNKDIKIVFGGPCATFLPEHLFKALPELDYIVAGEGEFTFLELAELVKSGSVEQIKTIKGLWYRKDNQVIKTEKRDLIADLDILPNPAEFFDFQHLSLSRGCPGNCRFCGSPKFWGKGNVRFHSADWFVDQIEVLYKKGITHFYISDDTFTMDKKRVIKVCEKIISRNIIITFAAISRVDFINKDILFFMRKAGCIQISFGVESGALQIRNNLGKPVANERIIQTFQLTGSYGILPRAYFIYGSPEETKETIKASCDLIAQIKPLSAIFYLLVIFPGTELYYKLERQGLVSDEIWHEKIEDIPWFEFDTTLCFEDVKKFGRELRAAFFKNLDKFALDINLVDSNELYSEHAKFLSRLGMTFSHGEYANNKYVKNWANYTIAEKLFKKALKYNHDLDAYLGLGMLFQKRRQFVKAISFLEKGLNCFPDSYDMNVCMGICFMNTKEFSKALIYFNKFKDISAVQKYIKICKKLLSNG